ncbi:hypothetical protein [Lunatimonas lonarensis]|uniref:hypothetical protein n=1 Tax=Lunatimonas lonarensis TaxID=1232681 RepID=UPI00055A8652|nr:hypothetical protein [Lunatimonas lonarensis]
MEAKLVQPVEHGHHYEILAALLQLPFFVFSLEILMASDEWTDEHFLSQKRRRWPGNVDTIPCPATNVR